MTTRDNRYKLPRNWIVLPIILYSLIFLLVTAFIALSIEIFSSYMTTLKAGASTENVKRLAKLYESSSESDNSMFRLETAKTGTDWFVTDTSLNIVDSSDTKITAKIVEYDPESSDDTGLIKINYAADPYEDIFYYADKNGRFINVRENSVSPDIGEILSEDNILKDINNGKALSSPYWTAMHINDGKYIIAFKTKLELTINDFGYFLAFFLAAYLIALLIFIVLISNIIRTHKSNKKMRNLVFRDNITGNRNWFWFVIKSKEILRKRKPGVNYAIVSLIFVRYRNFVLCHSVDEGEHLLHRIWARIYSYLDKKELVAHGTISNFPMLIKAETEDEAREKLETIIKSLENIESDHDFKFQAGVYMIDPSVRKRADIDLLYNNASTARMSLEDTDDTGIVFFDTKLVEDEKWLDKVQENQKDALSKEEFHVYYQPKYDPRTNELMGAEALVRWINDEMGFVPPGKFIPIFESNGFITEIDHYMLSHVAKDQKQWLDEGRACIPVSVNISRAHFAETDLAEQIRDIIDAAGTPHELIEIELTESAFFDDKKLMLSTITKLKEYGFLVSMDDFGSGYSSLNSLKDMPLDILKLDAGFFREENNLHRSEIVVSEAIQLAKKLNMKTVAEGIDEKEQVDFLAAEGCDMIQGYYYAKPAPKAEFEVRLGGKYGEDIAKEGAEAEASDVATAEASTEVAEEGAEADCAGEKAQAEASNEVAEEGSEAEAPVEVAEEGEQAEAPVENAQDEASDVATAEAPVENAPADTPTEVAEAEASDVATAEALVENAQPEAPVAPEVEPQSYSASGAPTLTE